MSAWEYLAVWFGVSVAFTPLIGYFLSHSSKAQLVDHDEAPAPQMARAHDDQALAWRGGLGVSAFR